MKRRDKAVKLICSNEGKKEDEYIGNFQLALKSQSKYFWFKHD